MFHFYLSSNAPEITAIQPPPAGNKKCASAFPSASLSPPACRPPSQPLLCADPQQLEASCSKSERAVKPACPRGQRARLPLALCHIICVELLLWVSIIRCLRYFCKLSASVRQPHTFLQGFFVYVVLPLRIIVKILENKNYIETDSQALELDCPRCQGVRLIPAFWSEPRIIPRHNLWVNMSLTQLPVAGRVHLPWSGGCSMRGTGHPVQRGWEPGLLRAPTCIIY